MSVELDTRGVSIATALNAAPAILRSRLNLNKYITENGGTLGSGVGTLARQQNAAAINAGIAYALANNLVIEAFPDRCEIDNTGGVTFMPNTTYGGRWYGAGFRIVQFALNQPCFTVGDYTGTNQRGNIIIDGLDVKHGTDQAGQTNGTALRLGNIFWSSFSNITAGSTGLAGTDPRSYNCLDIDGNNAAVFFSNSIVDAQLKGGYNTLFRLASSGTQNVFQNIYCQGGGGGLGAQAVTSPVVFQSGGAAMATSTFINFNVEWCRSQKLIYGDVVRGFEFVGLHMEGNELTGASPTFIEMVSSDGLSARGVMLLQNRLNTADGASGEGTILKGGFTDRAIMENISMRIEAGAATTNLPMYLFKNTTGGALWGSVSVRNFQLVDNSAAADVMTNFRLHTNMSESAYIPTNISTYYLSDYTFESTIPRIKGGSLSLRDSNHTHYGVFEDFTYRRGTAGAVSRDLTLSNKRGPSGSALQNLPTKQGSTVCVGRTNAWASPLVVKNHDGTTLLSMTGNANAMFYFNGTDWVLA